MIKNKEMWLEIAFKAAYIEDEQGLKKLRDLIRDYHLLKVKFEQRLFSEYADKDEMYFGLYNEVLGIYLTSERDPFETEGDMYYVTIAFDPSVPVARAVDFMRKLSQILSYSSRNMIVGFGLGDNDYFGCHVVEFVKGKKKK